MANSQQSNKDIRLQCVDCDREFIFTEGEQKYFEQKGLFSPKRCFSCRKKKREEIQQREANQSAEK